LSGDRVLLEHFENVIKPLNDPELAIEKESYPSSFAGINGPVLSCSEAWSVPGYLGCGTGVSGYKSAVVEDSDLPSLVCLKSVRTKTGIIHSGHDAFYMPDEPTQGLEGLYRKFPLDFDGIHYSMPFDKTPKQDQPEAEERYKLQVTPVGEHQVWMSWTPVATIPTSPNGGTFTHFENSVTFPEPQGTNTSPGKAGVQAMDQQDVASGVFHGPSWDPEEYPSEVQRPTLYPAPDSLESVAPEPTTTTTTTVITTKPKSSPSKLQRSSDRQWKRRVGQVLQEYAVAAIAGRPLPPLQEPEQILVSRKAALWESLRPRGGPPELPKRMAGCEVWDLWEVLDETGALTATGIDHSLRVGPCLSWRNGFDIGRDDHKMIVLEWQAQFKPRMIFFVPNTLF